MTEHFETPTLAIVIPAYKASYFEKALNSLVSQTNKNFTVYVGDDNSPDDLENICNKYVDKLNLSYTRFPTNIGDKNLVNQWNRCIALTRREQWLWLFSDDDIADSECAEKFFETLDNTKAEYDVYRFNTTVIDREDNIIHFTPQGPDKESSPEMAYNLLLGNRGNSMPDHIFSRKIFESNNGFVFTEYAQAADWATSILFSKKKGIKIIPGAYVNWRMSELNVSSKATQKKNKMLHGHLQFIEWLMSHFEYLKTQPSNISYEMIAEAAKLNLRWVITTHYKGLNLKNSVIFYRFLRARLLLSPMLAFKEILLIKKRASSFVTGIFNWKNKVLAVAKSSAPTQS